MYRKYITRMKTTEQTAVDFLFVIPDSKPASLWTEFHMKYICSLSAILQIHFTWRTHR